MARWIGGFSVSPSLHDKTKQYIQFQEKHHQKMSYKEEYGIDYNEKYLWSIVLSGRQNDL